MTNEQILKKAIEKANKIGWDFYYDPETIKEDCKNWIKTGEYFKYIFSPDFAKAFFGGDKDYWNFHRSKMLREEEPLKYLEKFI